jgi:hypothetical protein
MVEALEGMHDAAAEARVIVARMRLREGGRQGGDGKQTERSKGRAREVHAEMEIVRGGAKCGNFFLTEVSQEALDRAKKSGSPGNQTGGAARQTKE